MRVTTGDGDDNATVRPPGLPTDATVTCVHCGRVIVQEQGRWVDPQATGDDSVWRETCDAHDTFEAEHEPEFMETLTPEVAEALRAQLARTKRRDDIEILGITGVEFTWVQDWFGSVPGLIFEVEFTFTRGRRYRRTGQVPYRTHKEGGGTDNYDSVKIPPVLLQFLTDAVRQAGQPNDGRVEAV